MPKTKSYIDRVRIINRCLNSSKRFYTLDELTRRINDGLDKHVKERTVAKDIKDMRAEGAPIKNAAGKGYIYEPTGYNHFELKVLPAHLEKIKLASLLLKQIPGLDLHEELDNIFEDLQLTVNTEDERDIIQFDTRPNYEGAKHMVDVLEAIRGKRVISFDYQPFKYGNPKRVTVHPYLLKEYNNRWFLIGLPQHLREQKIYEFHQYGLERIKSKIKVEKAEHYLHHKFDAATLYKNVVGVSTPQGGKIEMVVLRFSTDRAKYISTNPWHYSQTPIKGDENTFQLELIPNMELESLILSYGADVEVMKPKSLRTRIATLILETGKKYF